MKRTAVGLSLLIFVAGFALAQSIKVTSPKAGEPWLLGSSYTVAWTFIGIPGSTKVKLMLWLNNTKLGEIADKVPIGSNGAGSWTWPKVGDYIGGTAAVGKGYEIRIRDANNLYPVGKGDGPFIIDSLSTGIIKAPFVVTRGLIDGLVNVIPVTKPGPGLAFKPGDALWINWDKAKIATYAQVTLSVFTPDKKTKVGSVSGEPGSLFNNTGTYEAYIFNALYAWGKDYIIRVATPDEKYVGWSGVFHVTPLTPVTETVTLTGAYSLSYPKSDKAGFFGCGNTFGELTEKPPVGFYQVGWDNSFNDPFGPCWSYSGAVYRTVFNPSGIYQGLKVTKAVLRFYVTQGQKKNFYILRRDSSSDALSVPATTVATVAGWEFGLNIEVDVTALIQAWCTGQTPNYGLIIRGADESFSHDNTKARCVITPPQLVITKITYK